MSSWHKTSQCRALSVSVYQHIEFQTLPAHSSSLPTTDPGKQLHKVPGLLLSTLALLCKTPYVWVQIRKGRAGFRLYFSEHVLPGRHVCLLAIVTFMWPWQSSVCLMCTSVCETACGGLHLFREFLRAPSFWRVTLRWLLVCVLLYPLYHPLTEEMSVGACCQLAGMAIKFILALGPLWFANSKQERKGKLYRDYCSRFTYLEASVHLLCNF